MQTPRNFPRYYYKIFPIMRMKFTRLLLQDMPNYGNEIYLVIITGYAACQEIYLVIIT